MKSAIAAVFIAAGLLCDAGAAQAQVNVQSIQLQAKLNALLAQYAVLSKQFNDLKHLQSQINLGTYESKKASGYIKQIDDKIKQYEKELPALKSSLEQWQKRLSKYQALLADAQQKAKAYPPYADVAKKAGSVKSQGLALCNQMANAQAKQACIKKFQ